MLVLSFLKTAWRGMRKSMGFTAIGILSLSIGMSVWLLLTLLVRDLQQYDRFHSKADQIVRITSRSWNPSIDLMVPLASSPAPLGPAIAGALPDVEGFVRLARIGADAVLESGVVDLDVFAADSTFFEVFDFKLEVGDPRSVLSQPNTMVLTDAAVARLFGDNEPIGEMVQLGTFGTFEVTGIAASPPRRSHLQFEALISMTSVESGLLASTSAATAIDDWQSNATYWNYAIVRNGADRDLLQASINSVALSNYPTEMQGQWDFPLEKLTEITLVNRDLGNQVGAVIGQRPLYVVSLFALVILIIAVFNYVGLAVSRSVRRSREIGVRKALGANRSHVVQQFLAESMLVAFASLLFSAFSLLWLIPVFNDLRFMRLAGVSLSPTAILDPGLILSFVGIAMVVGLVAGIVPALHLSRFSEARVLSGMTSASAGAKRRLPARRILVSLQFAASVLFVIVASIMWQQIDRMLTADYGFDRDQLVAVELQGIDFERLQNAAIGLGSVQSVAAASSLPVAGGKALTYVQSDSLAAPLFTYWYSVDAGFLNTLGVELVAGRGFDVDRQLDQSEAIILNETAARELGFADPRDAVEQWVRVGLQADNQASFRVVGVTRDFVFESDRGRVRRLALFNDPASWRIAVVAPSLGAANAESELKTVWARVQGDLPFRANTFGGLLSDVLDPVKDARLILTIAAGLALFLSCLGLIGFSAFTAETRRHEVAVRKIVGASAIQITILLLSDFARLMAMGVLLAGPIAFIVHSGIVQNFPVQATLVSGFVVAEVVALILLGLAVTCYQTLRVALADPVRVIRSS